MRQIKLLVLLVCSALLLAGCTKVASKTVEMVFFYDSPCASCDDEEKFRTLLHEETEDLQAYKAFSLRCVNTFQEGYAERDTLAQAHGVENPEAYSSMLFLGDSVLLGDAVAPNLRQFYWQAVGLGAAQDVAEYYYREDCPDCQSIAPQMQAYLEALEKPVVKIDTTDSQTKAYFRTLIEQEQVSKERYQIPYFIEDGVHYSGAEEIKAHIEG